MVAFVSSGQERGSLSVNISLLALDPATVGHNLNIMLNQGRVGLRHPQMNRMGAEER